MSPLVSNQVGGSEAVDSAVSVSTNHAHIWSVPGASGSQTCAAVDSGNKWLAIRGNVKNQVIGRSEKVIKFGSRIMAFYGGPISRGIPGVSVIGDKTR